MLTCFVRTLILYAVISAALRLMGKRQVGQLQPSELVVAIMISEAAAIPMQDFGIPLLYGVVPVVTLLCAQMLVSALCAVSPRIRVLLCGRPDLLIRRGQPDRRALERLRISPSELVEELRLKGVFDPGSVSTAVLETNGQLSVLLRPGQRPLSYDGTGTDASGEPGHYIVLIAQGRLLRENLALSGYDEQWIHRYLQQHGISGCRKVLLLSVDDLGGAVLWPASGPQPGQETSI